MQRNEKGGLLSRPIPVTVVSFDATESIALEIQTQVSRLVRTTISTDYESHKGDFPGKHGRYRLETLVTVVEGGAS